MENQIQVKINESNILATAAGTTVYEAARELGLITREVIGAEIAGETVALTQVLKEGDEVRLLTFADPAGKKLFRHSAAHVLAQAVKRLYPATKLTIGPAIDNGFYYDFDSETPFTADALKALESEMKKIVKENLKIERFELPREEAIALMQEKDEPYKVQLIEELPEGEVISFYRQGEFTDLCAGPHLFSTGAIKAFKLTQCTGAYWKGDQKNKMLQRIYGIAFPTKDELNAYVAQQEEALKRDHNKLGRELELFTTVDTIGQGLPVLLPKGARVIQLLQRWVEDEEQKRGYLLTKTPLMAKREFY
ncbi:MAG: threonine--tRNA ligase, partial [Clostridia bacterium]|nr:threonine--tRNA ligase [Clostridia bacterium]